MSSADFNPSNDKSKTRLKRSMRDAHPGSLGFLVFGVGLTVILVVLAIFNLISNG